MLVSRKNSVYIRVGGDRPPKTNSFEEFNRHVGLGHGFRLKSIGETMQYLYACPSYDLQPDAISIDPAELYRSTISVTELVSAVTVVEKVNQIKFGDYKKIKIVFRVGASLSSDEVTAIEASGISGIVPKATAYGMEAAIDSDYHINRGIFCPRYLISDSPQTGPELAKIQLLTTHESLTPRQLEIFELISHRGLSNKQIARHLNISESTVKLHVGLLLKKFCVPTRTHLVLVPSTEV